jgi:predicted metal-binding membrane protein
MQHGLHCVGCCWALMMLLFVGGVMNLVWAVALTLFVLAEKMLPRHLVLPRAAGVALILFGTVARLGLAS